MKINFYKTRDLFKEARQIVTQDQWQLKTVFKLMKIMVLEKETEKHLK